MIRVITLILRYCFILRNLLYQNSYILSTFTTNFSPRLQVQQILPSVFTQRKTTPKIIFTHAPSQYISPSEKTYKNISL